MGIINSILKTLGSFITCPAAFPFLASAFSLPFASMGSYQRMDFASC